jgi:hypothetical protein
MSVGWVHTYNPSIQIGGAKLDLPQPLMAREHSFENRITTSIIPLLTGTKVLQATRGALRISFQGTAYINPNANEGVEDLMNKMDTLEYWLMDLGNLTGFTFWSYYDTTSSNYRWYENCFCLDFNVAWGSRTVSFVNYSFSIIVPDGQVKEVISSLEDPPSSYEDNATINGPLVVQLDDADGEAAVLIQNSDGDTVAKIDSKGNLYHVGTIIQQDTIS